MVEAERRRGRGARSNHTGRFESERREAFDDGWERLGDLDAFKTEVYDETARTIITRNDSPDISFDQSINPYRGCEHGCIYCFARPTHCYLGHSAGPRFRDQALRQDQRRRAAGDGARPTRATSPQMHRARHQHRSLSADRARARITRSILEVLERTSHPVGIVTKSALVMRDIDILARMAARGLAKVAISVTTLDRHGRAQHGAARADAGEAARGDPRS